MLDFCFPATVANLLVITDRDVTLMTHPRVGELPILTFGRSQKQITDFKPIYYIFHILKAF
jgi:hypothetical protein